MLGLADARRRGTATDELARGWPERHVLVAGGVVVPDECDLIYVDGEQVEAAGLRMPSEVAAHRGGVPPLGLDVIDAARDSADLELALSAFAVGYEALLPSGTDMSGPKDTTQITANATNGISPA